MTTAPLDLNVIPKAPSKPLGAILLDLLIWGGVAVVLVYSIKAVNLGDITKLFERNEHTQDFIAELLRPDFADWKIYVAKMWETVQIALWGTFLAIFAAIPLGLAAARNIAPI